MKVTHIPERTCVVCRTRNDKFALIRITVQTIQEGQIDAAQNRQGRGMYLCPREDCAALFFRRKKWQKWVPHLLPEKLTQLHQNLQEIMQANKVYSLAGLARRAGKAAIGHDAVCSAIKRRQARLVILAKDASQNTREEILSIGASVRQIIYNFGNKKAWGKAFGKNEVAAIAILDSNFARGIRTVLLSETDTPGS